MGFYKLDAEILYAPNYVLNADYALREETQAENTYPVDGWYWFDTMEEAYSFFGVDLPEV